MELLFKMYFFLIFKAPKSETITMETILSAQENLNSIKKSIKSYKKSHELRMINLVSKEDTDSTKNKDL